MQVKREAKFQAITIVLDSKEELQVLASCLSRPIREAPQALINLECDMWRQFSAVLTEEEKYG